MNIYHSKMVDHVYPFLAEDWDEFVGYWSEWFDYDDLVVELVRRTRQRTTPGTSRLVQMTCLYLWAPASQEVAKRPPKELDEIHERLVSEVRP